MWTFSRASSPFQMFPNAKRDGSCRCRKSPYYTKKVFDMRKNIRKKSNAKFVRVETSLKTSGRLCDVVFVYGSANFCVFYAKIVDFILKIVFDNVVRLCVIFFAIIRLKFIRRFVWIIMDSKMWSNKFYLQKKSISALKLNWFPNDVCTKSNKPLI